MDEEANDPAEIHFDSILLMVVCIRDGKMKASLTLSLKLLTRAKKAKETLKATWSGGIENRDYGHLHILNEYAKVEFDRPIMGRLQHGWFGLVKEEHYYKNNLLPTFVWTNTAENSARNAGWSNFHAIGAPWLYLLKNLETWGLNSTNFLHERRMIDELWVFSLHSTSMKNDYGVDENDLEEFISRAIASKANKKIVLLSEFDYYKFKELKMTVPESLTVLSFGPRTGDNSSFSHLHKVFLLLTNTKKIMVDYVTVLLFYGLSVGCEVSWVKNKAYDLTLSEVLRENQLELFEMMSEDTLQPSTYLEFALTTLGLNALKTPGELRSLLRWNSKGNSLVNRFGICLMNIINLIKAVR